MALTNGIIKRLEERKSLQILMGEYATELARNPFPSINPIASIMFYKWYLYLNKKGLMQDWFYDSFAKLAEHIRQTAANMEEVCRHLSTKKPLLKEDLERFEATKRIVDIAGQMGDYVDWLYELDLTEEISATDIAELKEVFERQARLFDLLAEYRRALGKARVDDGIFEEDISIILTEIEIVKTTLENHLMPKITRYIAELKFQTVISALTLYELTDFFTVCFKSLTDDYVNKNDLWDVLAKIDFKTDFNPDGIQYFDDINFYHPIWEEF